MSPSKARKIATSYNFLGYKCTILEFHRESASADTKSKAKGKKFTECGLNSQQ